MYILSWGSRVEIGVWGADLWSVLVPWEARSSFCCFLRQCVEASSMWCSAPGPISPCTASPPLSRSDPLPWPLGGAWCWAVTSHLCPCSGSLVWGLLTFSHSFCKSASPTPNILFPSFPSLASNLQKSDRILEKSTSVKGGTEASLEWARENPEDEICCCCSVPKYIWLFFDPMDCSIPGSSVLHCLLEFAQTLVHWVSDAIQLSHPLSSPSPPAFNLSQYQGLFAWVSSVHQVAKVLDFQLQHQSFQWMFRVDFL